MRATSVLIVAALAAAAHASTRVVVLADGDHAAALQRAIIGRAEIATAPPPEGELRLDRAAVAQRSAVADRAAAAVWIEQEPGSAEVCVISADGAYLGQAPLPLDAGSPQEFAAVAADLLQPLVAPVTVDVHVAIAPPPPPHGAAAPRRFMLGAGPFIASHTMTFGTDTVNSAPYVYKTSYGGVAVEGAAYPMATAGQAMTGPGFTASLSRSIGATEDAATTSDYASFGLVQLAAEGAFHYRFGFGAVAVDGELDAGAVDTRPVGAPGDLRVPRSTYWYVGPGLHLEIKLTDVDRVAFGARYMSVLSSGALFDDDSYGYGTADGYAFDGSVYLPVGDGYYVLARAEYRTEHNDFQGIGDASYMRGVWSMDEATLRATATLGLRF